MEGRDGGKKGREGQMGPGYKLVSVLAKQYTETLFDFFLTESIPMVITNENGKTQHKILLKTQTF